MFFQFTPSKSPKLFTGRCFQCVMYHVDHQKRTANCRYVKSINVPDLKKVQFLVQWASIGPLEGKEAGGGGGVYLARFTGRLWQNPK